MGELRSIIGRKYPLLSFDFAFLFMISIPNVYGQTSVSTISLSSEFLSFKAACTAAPNATVSSGFILEKGNLLNILLTIDFTKGILVLPPIRTTASKSSSVKSASFIAF